MYLYLQSEANKAQHDFRDDLESWVGKDQRLELVSLGNVLSDMPLEILNAVQPQHEPEFQRSEPTSQRYLPVLPTKQVYSLFPNIAKL